MRLAKISFVSRFTLVLIQFRNLSSPQTFFFCGRKHIHRNCRIRTQFLPDYHESNKIPHSFQHTRISQTTAVNWVKSYIFRKLYLFWECFDIAVGKHPDNPKAQLLAVFEWIDELLIKPECYGCPFLITTSEFPQLDYPGHQVAIAHKKEMLRRLIILAENADIPNAEQLGKYLLLLVDGAFSQRRLFGLSGFESNLKEAAEMLINAQA